MVVGVTGIADNILTKKDGEINHDMAVLSLLETAQNKKLKFIPNKIQFKRRECKFLGSFSPEMALV